MSRPRRFRILIGDSYLIGCPTHIPWEMVAPYEHQAILNHQQDLEKLNSRGGLGPTELYAVMNRLRWRQVTELDEQGCVVWLLKELVLHFSRPPQSLSELAAASGSPAS